MIKVSNRLIDLFQAAEIQSLKPQLTSSVGENTIKFLISKNLKDWYSYDVSKPIEDRWVLTTSEDLRKLAKSDAKNIIINSTLDMTAFKTLTWNELKYFWKDENFDPNMLGIAYAFEDDTQFIDFGNFDFSYVNKDLKKEVINNIIENGFDDRISYKFEIENNIKKNIFQDDSEIVFCPLNGDTKDIYNNHDCILDTTDCKGALYIDNSVNFLPDEVNISLWFKYYDDTSSEQMLFNFGKYTFEMDISKGKLKIAYGDKWRWIQTNSEIHQNKFYFLSCNYNKNTGVIKAYLDSKEIYSGTNASTYDWLDKIGIKARYDLSSFCSILNGTVENVRIFNRALTSDEVKTIYNLEK